MEHKIHPADLKFGMYVSRLDRPWEDTTFEFQGFNITKLEEIERLKKECDYVYVHTHEKKRFKNPLQKKSKNDYKNEFESQYRWEKSQHLFVDPHSVKSEMLPNLQASMSEEIDRAKDIYNNCYKLINSIIKDIKSGYRVNFSDVEQNVQLLVQSITRNPDALIWLSKINHNNSYTFTHCINVCTYMIAFGHHLGLSNKELEVIGMSGLLQDIGKIKLPKLILDKPDKLNTAEKLLIREHVNYTIDILKGTPEIPDAVIKTIANHHERFDGTGYPHGLSANNINLYASMSGLIDSYDAMTTFRPYAEQRSPYSAIKEFLSLKNTGFSAAIIEKFIECIGIYSVGSIVELNSGEVGIVIEQNRSHRLRPRILLLLDHKKKPYQKKEILDLSTNQTNENNQPYMITHVLEPGSYDIDIADIFKY